MTHLFSETAPEATLAQELPYETITQDNCPQALKI